MHGLQSLQDGAHHRTRAPPAAVPVRPPGRVGALRKLEHIIGGTRPLLVAATGLGTADAEQVLAHASEAADGRRLYLTTTRFHPEHAFGAQVFTDRAPYPVNRVQADDLRTRGRVAHGTFRKGLDARS